MASSTTLNAKNLEALGAPRLAELLMEISKGDAAIKRHLRLELASLQSPGDVAREVRKRLKTIARSMRPAPFGVEKRTCRHLLTTTGRYCSVCGLNAP
jgi:hypothetical protein